MIKEGFIEKNLKKEKYPFDEGVSEAVRRIEELLESQDCVVIGIAGPENCDVNVGKTTLSNELSKRLQERRIPVVKTDSLDFLNQNFVEYNIKPSKEFFKSQKIVIMLGALGFCSPDANDNQVKRFNEAKDYSISIKGEKLGIPISRIDIKILIYDKEKGAKETESPIKDLIADIYIENEKAKEKKKFN